MLVLIEDIVYNIVLWQWRSPYIPGSLLTKPSFPLSFQADTHHSVGSSRSIGYVAAIYSKKSGDKSKSSENIQQNLINNSVLHIMSFTFQVLSHL